MIHDVEEKEEDLPPLNEDEVRELRRLIKSCEAKGWLPSVCWQVWIASYGCGCERVVRALWGPNPHG